MGQTPKKENCRSHFYSGLSLGIPVGVLILLVVAFGVSHLSASPTGQRRSTLASSDNIASEPGTSTVLTITLLGAKEMDNATIKGYLYATIQDNGNPLFIHDDLPGFSLIVPRENFEQVQLYGEDDDDSLRWEGEFTVERSQMENQEMFEDVEFAFLHVTIVPWSRDEERTLTRYATGDITWVMDLREGQ